MRLYIKFLTIHFTSQMQYKKSFFLTIFGQILGAVSTLAGVYFMFLRFDTLKGYTYNEVLLCFAVVFMSFSLAEVFARGFDHFGTIIRNSEFDRIMVRPRNEIFQVLAMHMDFTRIGRLFLALIIFAYTMPQSNVIWTPSKIITLIIMIISGTVVFSSLFLIYAAICFFSTEGLEFMNIFTDGGREFGRYPFSIYGKKMLKFFTFIVPLALFQYYPFLYLTDKSNDILYILCPLLAMLFIIPCFFIWKIGVRHYKSNGS